MLQGLLIKESIQDENILDCIDIDYVEILRTKDKPRYWTAIHFTTDDLKFPKKLAQVMRRNWYCDMKYKNTIKVLVFRKKVLQYTLGNEVEKAAVLKYCRKIGLTASQLDWSE